MSVSDNYMMHHINCCVPTVNFVMVWRTQEAYSVARQFNLIPPIAEQCEYNLLQRDKVELQMPEMYHKIGNLHDNIAACWQFFYLNYNDTRCTAKPNVSPSGCATSRRIQRHPRTKTNKIWLPLQRPLRDRKTVLD